MALFTGYVYIGTWKEVAFGCMRRGKENISTSCGVIGLVKLAERYLLRVKRSWSFNNDGYRVKPGYF